MHLWLMFLVASGALVEGNPRSTVRVMIFEDLLSADCARLRAALDSQLLPKYADSVAFEHRDAPEGPLSRQLAAAARYFDRQNPTVGFQFRRHALANRETVTADDLSAFVGAFAQQFAIDTVKAVAAMSSRSLQAAIEKDLAEAAALGITKHPAIFVNGKAVPFEDLESILSRKL